MTTEQQQRQMNALVCYARLPARILSGRVDCSHRHREETQRGISILSLDNGGRSLNLGESEEEEEERLVRPSSWSKNKNNKNSKNNNHNNININNNNITNSIRTKPKRNSQSTGSLHLWYKNGHPRAACTHIQERLQKLSTISSIAFALIGLNRKLLLKLLVCFTAKF